MTAASYALGRPRAAASRGGDCHAIDLTENRLVGGGHRFATTAACHVGNGMLRFVVGASGAAPALTVEAWRGLVVTGDTYSDVYSDTYGGSLTTRAWLAVGTITIDSPAVSALLSGVRTVSITAEAVTLRLIVPAIADAWVTLRRGERMVRIQHGSTRPALVDTDRRIRWTTSPSPAGVSAVGRVQEDVPGITGFYRWVGAIDPVTANAGAFSLTATSVTSARFGAGAGTDGLLDSAASQHAQLGDASRPVLVVA